MQSIKRIFAFLPLALFGCVSNPLNEITSERYSEQCAKYERLGDLYSAQEACYRAYINTEWGNLDKELKSQKIYNLARIKRRLSKFSEAESLLKDSIDIESSLTEKNDVRIGRRSVELAVNYLAQDKWVEASDYLQPVLPIVYKYSLAEREYIFEILNHLSEHFKKIGDHKRVELLKDYAVQIVL